MNIVYKTIETPKGYYVYDRSRNTILGISEEEYRELKEYEKKKEKPEDSEVFRTYQSKGFLMPNTLEVIEHPYTKMVGHHLTRHIQQLTLQVTQRCNLRCSYCVYGGNYENRGHSNLDMSFETAKKAIDIYLAASVEEEKIVIGFYGGEPLLKLDLIKQCVEYVKEHIGSKEVSFVATTNATLLTVPIAEYLHENHFNLTVSLDGSKEEHDEYRVFANGKGSFDVMMNNLKEVFKTIPDFSVSFNSVFNPKHNYENVKRYFEEGEIIADSQVGFNLVAPTSPDEEQVFRDSFYLIRAFDYFKLMLHMTGRMDRKYISKLVNFGKEATYKKYRQLTKKTPLGKSMHHGGPCIAGAQRLFVNVEGKMFPCERVSETSDIMCIGNVDSGLDVEKAAVLTNVGKVTEKECKNCWALFHCSLCASKADGGDCFCKETKLKYCKGSKKDALGDLKEICVLRELGCTFEEEDYNEEVGNLSVQL